MSGRSELDGASGSVNASQGGAVGRREAGKAARRQRIIHAARELIRETGNAGLSMRALAARAGVSLATPYNLFGSKRAIALAVLDDVREYQDRFTHLHAQDPLDRLFAAVDMAIAFYIKDPQFYKTLWASVFDVSDDLRSELYNPDRDAFWRGLIAATAEAGVLRKDIDVELLFRALDRCFGAAMLEWVLAELPIEKLAPTIRHSYALMLRGAASEAWCSALDARIRESQACIEAS